MMNSNDTKITKRRNNNEEALNDQVILDFYTLATGRLLTGLEVSCQHFAFQIRITLYKITKVKHICFKYTFHLRTPERSWRCTVCY